MSKVLMVSSEATPFAKTGGLADVIGALSPTLKRKGDDVAIVMPRYRCVPLTHARRVYDDLRIWVGTASYAASLYCIIERDVPYYFVDCPVLYDHEGLYGDTTGDFPDNHIRFSVFCHAALAVIRYLFRPDVIHCHDWQSALVPVYLKSRLPGDPTFMGLPTLLTIHNLGFQGMFPKEVVPQLGLDGSLFHPGALEFWGKVNLLKGGMIFADALSTVSRTYAQEIQQPDLGFGLDGILRSRSNVLSGILNGVDYTTWNPETDPYIAATYSNRDLSGKSECKRDLLHEVGLPQGRLDKPLIGIVSRFTSQKGFDLIRDAAKELAAEDVSLVALGTGEPEYERMFRELAAAHPDKFAVRIAYDNALAHKIEAGSDIFLMPSRYEPCGLNQIYSLRYGTVPVVRATGGLDDTVDESTGFKFKDYSAAAMLSSIRAALVAYGNPVAWRKLMLAGMNKDFSWEASASEYSELYRRLAGRG